MHLFNDFPRRGLGNTAGDHVCGFRQFSDAFSSKVKIIPQQAEVAQGVPGRLRPRIFLTFGTTRVVDRQPYALAAFTPGEIPGTHFQVSRSQGTWFRRAEPRKKISSDHRESIPGPSDRPLCYPRPPRFFKCVGSIECRV